LTSNWPPATDVRPRPVNEASADRPLMAALRPASAALRAWSRSLSRPVIVTWWVPMPIHTAPRAKTTKATDSDSTRAMPPSGPPPRRSGAAAGSTGVPCVPPGDDGRQVERRLLGVRLEVEDHVDRGAGGGDEGEGVARIDEARLEQRHAALARHLAQQLAFRGGVGDLVAAVVGLGGERERARRA